MAAAAAGAAERLPLIVETAQGPRTFQVELAVTPGERAMGLMFRRTLDPVHGMLFDFGAETRVAMWMRNTYIPLDMLFIGADRRIRRIERDTTPLSERVIEAGAPVRYGSTRPRVESRRCPIDAPCPLVQAAPTRTPP
jgi:uncharacterized protein